MSKKLTIRDLLKAGRVFQNDRKLVKMPKQPGISPLGDPFDLGTYSWTTFLKLSKEAIESFLLNKKKIVVAIGCMDKRQAAFFIEYVKARYGEDVAVFNFLVAGGIIQTGSTSRVEAMQVIIEYLIQLAIELGIDIEFVVSGHTGNCGGVGHFQHDGTPVSEALGCAANSDDEFSYIVGQIMASIFEIIPQEYLNPSSVKGVVMKVFENWQERPAAAVAVKVFN